MNAEALLRYGQRQRKVNTISQCVPETEDCAMKESKQKFSNLGGSTDPARNEQLNCDSEQLTGVGLVGSGLKRESGELSTWKLDGVTKWSDSTRVVGRE